MRVRSCPLLTFVSPHSNVFIAQVLVDNTLMSPVLVYQVQTAVGGFGQNDRLLQLCEGAQCRQDL